MTTEEARKRLIKWLKNYKWTNGPEYFTDWFTEEDEEAFRVAIKALSEPSVMTCNYCIHWNSETKGCKRNPSVEAWNPNDSCSYGKPKKSEK